MSIKASNDTKVFISEGKYIYAMDDHPKLYAMDDRPKLYTIHPEDEGKCLRIPPGHRVVLPGNVPPGWQCAIDFLVNKEPDPAPVEEPPYDDEIDWLKITRDVSE